jgi:Prenyltransferase and squalene oxidase repeat
VSWQLGAFTVLALALAAGFTWYERVRPDARVVALVGTLAAFAALGRIAFAAVPNVKPTTDIVLISGYALGGGPGFAVGALAGLSSNFFFGQGPWTPWQMAGWGAVGMIGAGLAWVACVHAGRGRARAVGEHARRLQAPPLGRWPLAVICCVVGFGFTALQDVGDWVTYSDHSWSQLGAYVGAGLGFDAIHAAGCLVFALAIGPPLIRSIQRFARRTQVDWIGPGGVVAPVIAVAVIAAALIPGVPPARAGGVSPARAAGVSPARAAGVSPARAAAISPAQVRSAAVSYLLAAQNADGGFGEAPGQPSNQLYAGWAALGLASGGYDLGRVARGDGLIAYIRAGAGSLADVGSLERTILVAKAAGQSARAFGGHDLVTELERRMSADGSVSGQVNLTSFAVLALRAAGVRPGIKTLGWLARQQDRDGGFSFSGAGGSSDVDDTGAALEALAGDGAAAAVRARAVSFLRDQQNRDGGFPSQPGSDSNAQSTAWAVQGLDAAGVAPGSLRGGGSDTPLAYLDSLAARDGAIRYSRGLTQTPVWVTGEALMALEGKPLPLNAPAPPAAPAEPSHPIASPPPAAPSYPVSPAAAVAAHAAHAARRPAGAAVRAGAGSPVQGRRSTGTGQRAGVSPASFGAVAMERLAGALGVITALVLAPLGLG